MTIDELNALATLTAGDEFPVWDSEESGESTKKITAQNMTASVKALGSLVNASEMNNALAGKQNTLTFDTTPTTGSTNPVTSGGVADAIAQSTAVVELSFTTSPSGVVSTVGGKMYQIGKLVICDLEITMTGSITSDWINAATLPRLPKDFIITNTLPDQASAGAPLRTRVRPDNGVVQLFYGGNGNYHVHVVYPTA